MRISKGWIPDYHGAWAMVTVPVIMGVILGGFVPAHLLLLAVWWIGYFDFYAAGLWLRSRRKARFFPPVRAYTIALAPFGIALAIVAPYLLWWVPVFLPLVATTAWASMNRKDRSLLNDVVTVGAAGLMLPVAYDLGTGGIGGILGIAGVRRALETGAADGTGANGVGNLAAWGAGWPWAWLVTLFVTAYFLGTIFYVKTNIRERNSKGWLAASAIYHLVFFATAVALHQLMGWAHVIVWAALVARAIGVPVYGRAEGWVSAKVIGFGEVAFSILVMVTLLWL